MSLPWGLAELAALGHRNRGSPVALTPTPSAYWTHRAVQRVLARLAVRRSAGNAADIRSEVALLTLPTCRRAAAQR